MKSRTERKGALRRAKSALQTKEMGKGSPSVRLVLSSTPPDPSLAELIRARTAERLAAHGIGVARQQSAAPAAKRPHPKSPQQPSRRKP